MFDLAPPQPAPIALQQHPLFAGALGRIGVEVRAHDGDGFRAQVICRRWRGLGRVGLISRGPVRDVPADPWGYARLRRALGVSHLIVNAETMADGRALSRSGFIRLARPQEVLELSLAGEATAWRARMHGKWRNRLVHAEASGMTLRDRPMPPDPNHWLLVAEARQQRSRGYRALPPALIAAMSAEDPTALRLFTAEAGGRPVAAMLFIRHGAAATYQIGWTGPEGRANSAHALLLWRAMLWLGAQGVRRIDLGQVNDATLGLTRFKLGSGAVARPLGGSWLASAALSPAHATLQWLNRPPP